MQKIFKLMLVSSAIIFGCFSIVSAQYCTPSTTYLPSVKNSYISRVRLETLDNQDFSSPDESSYDDFTQYGSKTMLTPGSNYTLTINAGPATEFIYMHYAAWIDYNNDKDFSDAGEKLGEYKTVALNEQFNFSFIVPAAAVISNTRLRVRCVYSISPRFSGVDPCVNYSYGEAEDHTVSIVSFQKVTTGITNKTGTPALFNMDADNDYDLLLPDEYSSTVPLQFYTSDGLGTNTSFSPITYLNVPLPNADNDNLSCNFCDLNNDNALDAIFTYWVQSSGVIKTIYYQKSGTTLIQTSTSLPNLYRGTSVSADFNNDGRQDVVICGIDINNKMRTYIYMNTVTGLVLVNDKLKGVYGEVLAVDYDNDSDNDIFVSGTDTYGNKNGTIYRNDGNWNFTDIHAPINKVSWGSRSQFGDFNNDGMIDLFVGNKIYLNKGNDIFTEIPTNYPDGVDPMDSHWGDINNDGILELISKEYDGVTIFRFNGKDSFILDQQLFTKGNIDIGFINNDSNQDIFLQYYTETVFLKNLTTVTNSAPLPPVKTGVSIGDSGFYSVTLKWSAGSDWETPEKGLTYNLRVGTSSTGNDIFSSMTSTSNNSLLKPGMGNVYSNTSWFLINLSPGTYYFSVQTVDKSGLTSAFTTPRSFTILAPLTQSTFTVPGSLVSAETGADFDGDKDIDLIIKNTEPLIYQQTAPNTYTARTIKTNTDIIGIEDFNNDNLPDIITKHLDSLSLLINRGNFVFSTINIDTLSVNNIAAADFDNDGDIDLLAYDRGYFYYENTGSMKYVRTKLPMTGLMYKTSISPIDIDRDNDIDFIISGFETNSYFGTGKCYTFVYKNNGNKNFVQSQEIIPGIGPSRWAATGFVQMTDPADITWNDLNFDGFPDLLITGDDEFKNNTNQVFLNDGTGKLTATSLSPRPSDKYSSTWIDFNNDGYLDIIMPKAGFIVDNTIYLNNNNTGYSSFANSLDDQTLTAYLKAIDVDNDKDKDIVCTFKIPAGDFFKTETKIYTNNNNKVNLAPNSPTITSSQIDVFDVILNWNNGWDKLTGNNGLSYNIWVGTANNKADIVSPMADLSTGYRYVEALGNVGTNTSWRLKNLPLGTYYWSVQTIDNSMTPSAWAPVKSFTLSALTANFTNDEVCLGFDTHLSDNSVTTHPITSWKWVMGGKTVSTAQNPVLRFTTPGNNSVKLVVESSVAKDSITKNVYVKPLPDAAFTNTTVCAGIATTFTNTTSTNGLTINEWHWDFGDNSGSNVQNPGTHGYLVAGTYTTILVAVASNSCSDTVRNIVNVGIVPTAAITLSGPPNFCSDDSVKLSNLYTATYSYSWQTGGADITGAVANTYTARQTGSYTVKVTNPVGNCTVVSPVVNITVKEAPLQPAIAYTGEREFCAGENLILSAPDDNNLTYKWKLNGGSVGKDTSIHAAEIGGEYALVVTNSQGCSSFSVNKVEIKVNPRPAAATLSPPSKPQICQGEDVVLGVTSFPAYSYQWLNENIPVPGAVTNTFNVTATGKYQIEISNANGCSIKTNTVDIVVNTRPVKPLIITTNNDKNNCPSGLRISIDNPVTDYNYAWFRNGAPFSMMTFIDDFLENGTYFVVADLNGCNSTSEVITLDFPETMPKPVIEAKGTVVWYLTTNSRAEYYNWYFNGIQVPGATTSNYIAGQKLGNYRVSISNDGKCYRISDAVTIPAPLGLTGIEDPDPFEGVKIYPNPTTGMFTIEMNNNVFGELVIDIITQNGSKILNIKFEKTTEHFSSQIDLSGQSKGMYLINLSLDKFRAVRKVVVE